MLDGARSAMESGFEATSNVARQGFQTAARKAPGYFEGVMDGAKSAVESGYEATVGAAQQGLQSGMETMAPVARKAATATTAVPGAISKAYQGMTGISPYQDLMEMPQEEAPSNYMDNLIDELRPVAQRMYGAQETEAPQYLQAPEPTPVSTPTQVPVPPTPRGVSAPEMLAQQASIPRLQAQVSQQPQMPTPMPTPMDMSAPQAMAQQTAMQQPAPQYIAEPPVPQQGQNPMGLPDYMVGTPMPTAPEAMASRQGTPVDPRMQQFQYQTAPPAPTPYVDQPVQQVPGEVPQYMQAQPQSTLDKIKGVAGGVMDFVMPAAEGSETVQIEPLSQYLDAAGVKKKPVAYRRR